MSCMATEHGNAGCNLPTAKNPRGAQSGGPGTTVRVVPRDRPRTAIVVSRPDGGTSVVQSRQPMPAPSPSTPSSSVVTSRPAPTPSTVVVLNRPAPAPSGIEAMMPPRVAPVTRTSTMPMPTPSTLNIPSKVMDMPRPAPSVSTMTPPLSGGTIIVAPKTPMIVPRGQGQPSVVQGPSQPVEGSKAVAPSEVSRTSPLDMPVQPSIAKTPLAEVLAQTPAEPVPSGLSQRPSSSQSSGITSASAIMQAMTPSTEFKAAGKPFAGRFRAFGRACWTFQNMPPHAQAAVIAKLPAPMQLANLAEQVKQGQPGADSAFIATVAKMPDAPAAIIDAVAKVASVDNVAPVVALVADTKPAAGAYRPAGAPMAPSSLTCGEAFRMLPRDAQLRVMLGPSFFASESAPRDMAVMLNQNMGGDPANAFLAWVRTRYAPNSMEQAVICGMIDAEARRAGLASAPAGAAMATLSPDMLRAVTPEMVQTLASLCPNVANAVRRSLADLAVVQQNGVDRGGFMFDRAALYAPAGELGPNSVPIPPELAATYTQAQWDALTPAQRLERQQMWQRDHAPQQPGTAQQVVAGIGTVGNTVLDAIDRDARNTLARRNADAAAATAAQTAALARQVQEDSTRLSELRIRLGQTTDPLQQTALAQQVTDLSTRLAVAQATQTAQQGWWSQQSSTTQAAVGLGGAAVVLGGIYLATRKKG